VGRRFHSFTGYFNGGTGERGLLAFALFMSILMWRRGLLKRGVQLCVCVIGSYVAGYIALPVCHYGARYRAAAFAAVLTGVV